MKKVVVLGHFAFGLDKANGQTIKTKVVGDELKRAFGKDEVDFEDTMGGWRFMLRLPMVLTRMLWSHSNIVILPAYKGVLIIVPLLVIFNTVFHRRLHYVVIGGWLPEYARKYPILRFFLKRIDMIYVETYYMASCLTDDFHFKNILVMPNSKPLQALKEEEIPVYVNAPFRLCTFSRVMREKGIEDAIHAVCASNQLLGSNLFTLDIYGLVEPGEEEWFRQLMSQQPEEIKYGGIIPTNKSTEVLQHYFALLFPTHFKTEGFAGTLIDAMAAALPPIASKCHSNVELIEDGKTGLLFPIGSIEDLTAILMKIAHDPTIIQQMRSNCLRLSGKYEPHQVFSVLIKEIETHHHGTESV